MDKTGDGSGQPVESVELSDIGEMFGEEGDGLDEAAEGEEADESEVEEDAEQEDDDKEESEDDPTIVLKHDGKDVPLKKSEVVELAQKGFDYTNKTMAVAEERKAVEAERAQAVERRQQYEGTLQESLTRLNAWTEYMQASIGAPPDRAMLDYDTDGYIRANENYKARQGELQQAYAAQQTLEQERNRTRQSEIQHKAAATERVLTDTLPGWNNDMLTELSGYAEKLGLSFQVAQDAMLEPGFWQLAQKAREYDRIQAAKSTLKPKVEMPKVAKPGASNPVSAKNNQRAKNLDAFNRNPNLSTIGNIF